MSNKLLAPNGKPSNLNATQYKLVRSKAFLNWFGDWINDPANASKVVDEETREPLVVYHGTRTNFTEFNIDSIASNTGNFGHYGYGFYFSDDIRETKSYGDIILTCFLNFRNPFTWNHKNIILLKKNGVYGIDDLEDVAFDRRDLVEKVSKVSIPASELLQLIIKKGYEGGWEDWLEKYNINDYEIDFNDIGNLLDDKYIDHNKKVLKALGVRRVKTIKDFPYEQSLHWITNLGERSKEVTEIISNLGFDSIVYGSEFIAFKPNQIKIADGTNTTFDSSSDDIRFEQGGELKAEDMLKHPLTIKRLKDLDDNDGYWVNHFHAKTKNYKPNTYYHLNTDKGLNSGVGKGLYLGRDKDALISFYDLEGENKKIDAYFGNPNWLDLMDYTDYDRYEQEAIRKFDKNKVSKSNLLDLDSRGEMLKKLAIEKGFDGIRYYDPQATGEEFVLFDVKKVKKINDEISFAKGGKTKGDCYVIAGQLALEIKNKNIDYKGTPYLVHAEVKHSQIEGLRYGHAFIEDDENVYDFSNNREIIMPKQLYYYFGDINPRDKKKYRKYTFKEAREKMLSTGHYGCWDIEVDYKKGGRTIAQTPAPKQDQVQGSDVNKKSSSKDLSSAKLIKFDDKTLDAIKNKVKEHNGEHPDKKINLSSAKAVVRRGMGAYSKSHRPTITGGMPNSRLAWGLARLNAFTYKIVNGKSKSGKYSQDDDLIEELGFKVADYKNGGKMGKDIRCINCGWEWNKKDSEAFDMYVCHKCGFDNTSFYNSDPINQLLTGGRLNSVKGVSPDYLKMFLGN